MNIKLKQRVKSLARDYFQEIIETRRHLHKYPELSKEEFETSNYICSKLDNMGLRYRKNIGGNGIMGFIEGKNPEKKCIAFRSDMDALPIQEESDKPYKSSKPGVMHACGHDAHMAMLLGGIKILNTLRQEFEGRIMYIFQPSEEEYPGGAISMLNDGVFDKVIPEEIYALHSSPEIECGYIGMKEGKFMASTDEIYIDIIGKGGHGGIPHLNIDPILTASHVVVSLQSIVSRNSNPSIPTTFSIGRFIGDGKTNIIPDKVRLEGIIRTFDEEWREESHKLIERIVKNTAKSFGAEAEVFIDSGYPHLYNHPELCKKTFEFAREYLGKDKVLEIQSRMTADDFSYFSQRTKGCYFRIGTKKKGENIRNLHTKSFDIDEKSLEYGIGIISFLAISSLNA